MSDIDTILKFSVDKIDFMEEANNSLFRKAKIKAFASGENAHTLPVSEDVIKKSAFTIYNKPILWKYDDKLDDAMGHEEDEVPCGFVPETFNKKDNPISFERSEDGRLFIVITAYIWTKYSGRLIEIFNRDDSHKDVSIEMVIVKSENKGIRPKILEFVIAGITILGEWVNPACKGAKAELLEFSEDRKKYEYMKNRIEIKNEIDFAVSGSWRNPRGKLFNPIIVASNFSELFDEAYLLNNSTDRNSNISEHMYPHHVIKDGKMVIHKDGLNFAFKRAILHEDINDDVIEHLKKHYIQLGLNASNYSEFDIDDKTYNKYFSNIISEEKVGEKELDMEKNKELLCSYFSQFTFANGEETCEKYSVDEVFEDKVVCTDKEFGCKYEIGYSINENSEVFADMENMKKMGDQNIESAAQEEMIDKEEEQQKELADEKNMSEDGGNEKEDEDDDDDDDEDDDKEEKEEKMSYEELEAKYSEMCNKFAESEEKNRAYMSQIESMSDYEDLKKFKCDMEEKEKREAEMAEMNKVMSEIEGRGIKMSDSEKQELIGKFSEFSSVDAWANFAKAQIFDRVENIDGILKIGMPFQNKNKSTSVWSRL